MVSVTKDVAGGIQCLSLRSIFITCSLATLLIVLGVYSRALQFIPISFVTEQENVEVSKVSALLWPSSVSSNLSSPLQYTSPSPSSSSSSPYVRVITPGENIQVGDLQVHITTAVQYGDAPARDGFNLFLNGWARHKTPVNFKCCLIPTVSTATRGNVTFVEIPSVTYHVYTQWIVDMQNAEFSCSLTKERLSAMNVTTFSHVTFAKDSCQSASRDVMEILQPKPVSNSVGLCLKITYGTLNPEKMIEWFEYSRLMNVTKVFTYYFEVDPPVFKVLDYYRKIGYLDLLPIHPAKSKGGKDRGFRKPRYDRQAWVDEVMGANDCKHRMAGFDYVIVMDMDEFIVPKGNAATYFDVLREAEKAQPKASCFSFDAHVIMLDWGVTRTSPLHLTKYTRRTAEVNYDGWDRNIRWGFKPQSTFWVQNNNCFPGKGLIKSKIPESVYMLWHYRDCKWTWKGCNERKRVEDTSMLVHEKQLVDRILSLPVKDILYNNTDYVNFMVEWKKRVKT